jgi:hypothetical protein
VLFFSGKLEPDSLRRSGEGEGESEGERVWMHRTVETMVSGGKNGDPISHWRPVSFLWKTSFGHRTLTLVFSMDTHSSAKLKLLSFEHFVELLFSISIFTNEASSFLPFQNPIKCLLRFQLLTTRSFFFFLMKTR